MELLQELVGRDTSSIERKKRLDRAKEDFGFFCRYYLGHYFSSDAAEYQKVLYEVANSQSMSGEVAGKVKEFVSPKYQGLVKAASRLEGAMFIEPREHGKTVRWSFAYPLWRVLTGRSRYILLVGATDTAAKENLYNIRSELENNELLIADYGNQQGPLWKDNRIELSLGCCIQSKGAGSSMRGTRYMQYRPDLIILDDLLKDEDAESYTVRDKVYRWLKKVVFNLGKSSFIVWVNTIFHNDDPISRLCKEVESGQLRNWTAVRLGCLLDNGNGKPLWPEYWTREQLLDKKRKLGVTIFATEYMNEAISEEDLIVKPEWIHYYEDSELPPPASLVNVMGCDPATGKHDHTALVPLSWDKSTGFLYVRPVFAKACSENETIREVCSRHELYHFVQIGWEDVVFSGIYGNFVQKEAAQRGIYLPIKLLSVHGLSKEARVRSITPLIENGFIRFPRHGAEKLVLELTEFPKGAFDDLCDALVHAVNVVSRTSRPVGMASNAARIRNTAKSIISKVRFR